MSVVIYVDKSRVNAIRVGRTAPGEPPKCSSKFKPAIFKEGKIYVDRTALNEPPKRFSKFKPVIFKEGQRVPVRIPYCKAEPKLETEEHEKQAFDNIQRIQNPPKKKFDVDLNNIIDILDSP